MSSYYEKILATGEVKCIDEEIPFEVPKGWEWCRLRDVIYPPKYGTSSKSLSNGDVPVLRMGNIQDGEVVYDKLVFSNNVEDNRKYLLQDGDLLFNRTNSAELVGKTAIFKGNRHVIYAGYLILLRPIKTNSEYLNYIFSSPYVRSYCKEVKTIGVQQCNINAEKVSQLLVPIAPFEEQMRIVDKIKEVLPSVDKYSISQYNLDLLNVSLSECLKKSILQEAIQGRLVPQIAEEGTAKELLEQIKTEKQKLVKEGKLKKSALNDSIIFKGDDNKYLVFVGKTKLRLKSVKVQQRSYLENVISNADYTFLKNKLKKEDNLEWYFVVRFLAATGARVSELIQIKVEHVQVGYYDIYTKGGKIRRIYIPKKLRMEAEEWLKQTKRASGYLFLNRYGERITTRGISQQLKNYAEKYGLNKKVVYPHSFRHRFAKNFLEKFNDISLLADLMGHESIETTRIYLRRSSTEQQQIVDEVITW